MLKTELLDIEKKVEEAITLGLKMIKAAPSVENEILQMFMTSAMKINDYFIKETERLGTESVGKKVVKYAMFKKF